MRYISRRILTRSLLSLVVYLFTAPSFAQNKPSPVAVREGASITLKGKVQGYTGASYTVHAEAGQRLQVSLHTLKGATLFNVYSPGTAPGEEALFRGEVSGDVADLKAAQSGDYRIDVYQMRSYARRATVAPFSLTIALRK